MPRQPKEPNDDVILALNDFRLKHGRSWRNHLRSLWLTDKREGRGLLRLVRNNYLPWLARLTSAKLAGLAEQARYRDLAAQAYETFDDVEIEGKAEVSASEDGAWVQAWVWIPNPDLED